MKISIFGLGYVGCVSIGCLAKNGHSVIGVDVNETKVDFINQGKASIVENEIEEIIQDGHQKGLIHAVTDGGKAVLDTEISIICVGTPSTPNGHLYLDGIYNVARQIGQSLKEKDDFHIVMIRSTVLPGTNAKVASLIEEASGKTRDKDFAVLSNPEFLREGTAVKDYFNPPYTLVGGSHSKAIEKDRKNVYRH